MAITTSINLSSLDGSNGFRLDGGGYYFNKFSLSSAGDINGDGFDDVAIGTYFDKYYSEGSYVVFGKTSGFNASMSLFGLDGENGFGIDVAKGRASSVSRAGDINGDGFDDMVIVEGGRSDYYGYFAANNAYVVFGKQDGFNASLNPSDLDGSNGFHLEGGTEHKFLGVSVSGAGDVNGDGLDDLIIGNSGDHGSNSLSSSYVVFGKTSGFDAVMDVSDLDGVNGFRLDGEAEFDFSGYAVSGAGDMNGDGFDDLIIGAPFADPNGRDSGSSYVVFGKASGFDAAINLSALNGVNGFRLDGVAADDESGYSVSSAGDVNGDGFNDLLVSERSFGSYVIFGKATGFDAAMNLSTLDGSNGFHLDGSGLVIPVSSAGDVNRDGFDDLIIGNSRADLNGYFSGSSYVMFGKASGFDAAIKLSDLDSTNSVRLDGVARVNGAGGDQLGVPVSGAGDINGDGYDDLMIGAPDARINFGAGSVYVVFGSSEFDGTVTYVGTPENDSFTGTEAAEHFDPSAGNDLLIGGGGADVMYGGKGDDTIRVSDLDFQLVDGGSGNDTLALDGSGMNLDLANFQDKISGIETIDLGGTGNNILTLTVRDVIKLSNTTDALTVKGDAGNRVAGLSSGWVDGGIQDGFHVLTQNSAELRIATAVDTDFVANGGGINLSTLDGVNGFRLDGANDRDFSGKSVSNAGDVNGDGFDDVIIGAPGADPNGDYSGSSYVVFSNASGFDATVNHLSDLDGSNGFRLDGTSANDEAGASVVVRAI